VFVRDKGARTASPLSAHTPAASTWVR
jgi:hypothetical protein